MAQFVSSRMSAGPMNLLPDIEKNIIEETSNASPPKTIVVGNEERRANRAFVLERALHMKLTDIVTPHLVHGNYIAYVQKHNPTLSELECDGLITERSDLGLTVTYADCPSVMVFDGTYGILGLAHAGWRGVRDDIIHKLVNTMVRIGGDPDQMIAHIGPSIRKCCYEVGPDVAEEIDGQKHVGQVMIDLPDTIVEDIEHEGVPHENISVDSHCTKCSVDEKTGENLYFSYRRDHTDPHTNGIAVAVMRRNV